MVNIQVTLINVYVEHNLCVLDLRIRSVGPLGMYMYITHAMICYDRIGDSWQYIRW